MWRLKSLTSERKRTCEAPSCTQHGAYRAPRHDCASHRHDDNSWYWFCLKHIRDYNAAWDFYKNMTEAEIIQSRRNGMSWDRPIWPIGQWSSTATQHPYMAYRHNDHKDPFGLFNEDIHAHKSQFQGLSLTLSEKKALQTFQLSPDFNMQDIHQRYRALVKKYHPDVNGGTSEAEEKIKEINIAYEILTARFCEKVS